ncbi:glycosyltransferase [Microbacterium arborescens]|uniref:glycosyltransferase n=1 Tax=Microbacterium arborescens TaxID=33883 RepID=UPI0012ED2094|nr:glycosyltransferase [Microbacterium arborescens]
MVTVLESDKAPGGGTRFVDQVTRYPPDGVRFVFFTWRNALLGRYDVFHVHWPEALVRAKRAPVRVIKSLLFALLLARIRLLGTRVVRTHHNITPHASGGAVEKHLCGILDTLVDTRVVLNTVTPVPPGARTVEIPHGDYIETFGRHGPAQRESGLAICFGRIEPYKRVDLLARAFGGVSQEWRLRIVGRAAPEVRRHLEDVIGAEERVIGRFEFVSDADLVREVTAASVAILPYAEVHNSGVALVALSLGTPIIARTSASMTLLQGEVGSEWVYLLEDEISTEALQGVLQDVARDSRRRASRPPFRNRDWHRVGTMYGEEFMRLKNRRPRARAFFINPSGQRDNIGDSVLRRPYIEALRSVGRVHVLVGGDEQYASGLGLSSADHVYTSRRSWLLSALRHGLSGRLHYAMNAGEIVLRGDFIRTSVWQLPIMLVARCGGGRVVAWGIARRAGRQPALPLLRLSLALCTSVYWRDQTSALGASEVVMPDWAFSASELTSSDADRSRLVVSFRSDRPALSDEQVDALRSYADREGLVLTVATQVRRDEESGRALAVRLDAELMEWPPASSHAEQERRVRELYRSAAMVVSDRIHVLILAAMEGARIAGLSTVNDEKVKRTLGVVIPRPISTSSRLPDDLSELLSRQQKHESPAADIAEASERLRTYVSREISRVFGD